MNSGNYNRKIEIYQRAISTTNGFQQITTGAKVLTAYARVKTTRGITLIRNDSDFEKALTNFTIRFPHTAITRDMLILYGSKTYTIEYLNNVDEANVELEIQAKEITH